MMLVVENPSANAGDKRDILIPALGRSPERGYGTPLLYACLESPMDRGGAVGLQCLASQRVRHDCRDLSMYTHLFKLTWCKEDILLL